MHLIAPFTHPVRGAAARQFLGADHPLVGAEERVRSLRRQAASVATLLAAGALAFVLGIHAVTFVSAVAFTEVILLALLGASHAVVRHQALELIADGRASLPLGTVQRAQGRLVATHHRRDLARALARLRCDAHDPWRCPPQWRPLFVPAVVRGVDGELARAVGLLLAPDPDPTVVARIERLLSASDSPLYGDDLNTLRTELHRITFTAAQREVATVEARA